MDISSLKEQLNELRNKVENSKKQTTEERMDKLEKELKLMKNRYIKLLEFMLNSIGNRKSEISNRISKRNKKQNIALDKFQLLLLLSKSKATSTQFAVSAKQIRKAFSINRTIRTVRDKLAALEVMNLVKSIGQKPKLYFIVPKGLKVISQQQKGLMRTHKDD